MSLALRAEDITGPTRWRWRLTDEAGRFITSFDVDLASSAGEYEACADLHGYLRRNAAHDDRMTAEAALMEHLGSWLGEFVLGAPIGRALADRQPATVRVCAPASAGFLLSLPLELAHAQGRPLATSGVTLAYVLDKNHDVPGKQPASDRLRMLAVFSQPPEASVLSLRRERHELMRLVRQVSDQAGRAVELRVLQYGVTRDRLHEVASEQPGWDVLHLSGHGTRGAVVLDGADGTTDLVATEELTDLLRPAARRLKLAVLSSCDSGAATAAETLRWLRLDQHAEPLEQQAAQEASASTAGLGRGLAENLRTAVLAMRYPVSDSFATAFAGEFYARILGNGEPVDAAMRSALTTAIGNGPTPDVPALSICTPMLIGDAAGLDLTPPPAESAPGRPATTGPTGLPPEPERFVGRTRALITANAALAPGSSAAGILLTGMAGSGKTTCALEIAYQHRDFFDTVVWWRAPDDEEDPGSALAALVDTLEGQLAIPAAGAMDGETGFHGFLSRLSILLTERAVLLGLDNLETLLTPGGEWRDPMTGLLLDAVTGHGGRSRALVTSRRVPARPPGALVVTRIGTLSLAESVLLARELPQLGKLLRAERWPALSAAKAQADRVLAREVINVLQGHPKLLELADKAAGDPGTLRQRLAAAHAAAFRDGAPVDAFFDRGDSELDAGQFLEALEAWTTAVLADLPAPARRMAGLLACLEDGDRAPAVIEALWPQLPAEGDGQDETGGRTAQAAVLLLLGTALVEEVTPALSRDGTDPRPDYVMHPSVARAIRDEFSQRWREAVDDAAGRWWCAALSKAWEGRGEPSGPGLVAHAGLAAAPYLLRGRFWAVLAETLDLASRVDPSAGTTRRLLHFSQRVLAEDHDPGRRIGHEALVARVLSRIDRAAGITRLRSVQDQARADGRPDIEDVVARELTLRLLAHGDLSGALAEAADVAALTERLGKSLWARAPVDGLRLQALHLMGAPEEVLEQAQALLENLEQAPPEPDMTPADRTGATETILMAAYTAAMALRRFPQALEFNQRIHQDRQAGGSPAPPASAARFYDCSPLIELGRLDEAQQILDDSQRFFEETRNDAMMGFALNIRARLESERGHHGEALTAARNALRFMYRLGEPAATAETHLLLAVQMRACGADPREAVAHDFAAALLSAATGFSVHPEFTMGMLIAAAVHERGVRVLPADLDELIARVERVPGARLGDRLAALIPEEASRLRAFTETATEAAEHAWNMRGRGPLRSLGGPGAPPPRPGKPRTTTAAGRDAQRDARDAILAARRAFGDDHPSTLFARHALGRALTAQGRLAEAEAELRAVADARARLLGADHPLVLSVRAGRSLVLRDLGHFAEAEAECANLAAAHTRVSGPDHLETLGARSNLVIVLNASGKLAEAEAEARTVVAGSTRVLGPDDRLTLAARANLALSCLNQGKLAEAEIEARSVLDGYGRIASRDDEDSLIVRTLLTRCLHKQGRIAEAEAQARTARAAAVRVLGIGHQVTRRASGVLALILADQDYSAAAEREIRVIVRAYDRSLGAEHPEALGLRQSLADFLAKGGALEAASRERDALDAAARRARQPDHPSVKAIRRLNAKATLNLHQERAAELLGRGDFAAVRSQFQALAADAARLPGPDSQGAAMVGRVNAACMLIRLGNAADAAAELEEIVSACHAAGGQQRDIEMTARTNLATALADLGRYPQAAAHERVVLGWLSRTYGPDHPDTAASRDFLANLLRQDGAPDAGAGR